MCSLTIFLAQQTHSLIGMGLYTDKGVNISETSITELNLLSIGFHCREHNVIRKYGSKIEGRIGADWLWAIGSPTDGWRHFLVQAKIIQPDDRTAKELYYPKDSGDQLTKLIAHAKSKKYYPMYCIYSHVDKKIKVDTKLLCETEVASESAQFGCALLSAYLVKSKKSLTGTDDFKKQENLLPASFPWMAPFCCRSNNPEEHMAWLLDQQTSILREDEDSIPVAENIDFKTDELSDEIKVALRSNRKPNGSIINGVVVTSTTTLPTDKESLWKVLKL